MIFPYRLLSFLPLPNAKADRARAIYLLMNKKLLNLCVSSMLDALVCQGCQRLGCYDKRHGQQHQ